MITPRYHREIPQRYRLEAGKCTGCGKVHFPPRQICKECHGREFKTVTMFRNMMPFDRQQRQKYPFGWMRMRNWILERTMLRSMLSADLVIFIDIFE